MSEYAQYNVTEASKMLNLGCGQPGKLYLEWGSKLYYQTDIIPINLFQYGIISGHDNFKEMIIDIHKKFTNDNSIKKNEIFMTNGISQAMLFLTSIFREYSEHTFVENPTYFLMIDLLKNSGYKIHTFDLESENYEEYLCKEFNNNMSSTKDNWLEWFLLNNRKILLYIIPFHRNPCGTNITHTQIKKLVDLCDKYSNIVILSDETYQFLSFDINSIDKSLAIYHENIISMSTFSKIYLPAVRLGYIYTKNKKFIEMMDKSGFMDSGGAVNPIIGYQLSLINRDKFIFNIISITDSLRTKCNILCNELSKYPEHFKFNIPSGGYFIWVKSLKCTSHELLEISIKNGVQFHVGTKFSPSGNNSNYFRLSFSYYSYGNIKKYFGERLSKIVCEINKKTVYLHGSSGRLGKLIFDKINSDTKYDIISVTRDNIKDLNFVKNSIIIDVTLPLGTYMLLSHLIDKSVGIPLIIGTTGHNMNILNDLIDNYKHIGGSVLLCPNFSVGVSTIANMLKNMITETNYWDNITLIDDHHAKKVDKLSGTSKLLLKYLEGYSKNDIKINSIREGDTVGTHTIIFEAENEIFEIKHIGKDRKLFSDGCVGKIINYFENGIKF